MENVVIKATAKKLTDRYQTSPELYVDLLAVFLITVEIIKNWYLKDKVDTKPYPKISQSTLTAIPKVQPKEKVLKTK